MSWEREAMRRIYDQDVVDRRPPAFGVRVQHTDSRIDPDGDSVVWRMSREVAAQLSMLVHAEAVRTGDMGWWEDSAALLDASMVEDDRP